MASLLGNSHNVPSDMRLSEQALATLNYIMRMISKNTCASGEVNIKEKQKDFS